MAINLLKNNPTIRENLKQKYSEILIDEYQDTNDIQEHLFPTSKKQCLYGRRY